MSYKRIGNYIHLVNNRNKEMEVINLLGINVQKTFMPSVANVTQSNLSNYKIIKKGQFAYSAMQVGRDETIRLALYDREEPAIISPAYFVIEVNDENELIPEYMMMWFLRPESDRYGWFISDGSVRASLDWDRFCEIEIPIPDIETQKKYVALYNGLQNNQKSYESGLDDLQLICDTYIEDLIKKEEPKLLVDYIKQCDERNHDLQVDNLLGISVNKTFIPSKANAKGLNLSNYKIVHPRQFGFVTVTSRNGEKISIGILEGEPGIVSSTYVVFEVTDQEKLLPEFLYLFFQREEFDRYARFHSWGSARETFTWEDMCNVELPIPSIEVQKAIVTLYHTLETRKRINEELKAMLKPLCPVLMRGVVESEEKEVYG